MRGCGAFYAGERTKRKARTCSWETFFNGTIEKIDKYEKKSRGNEIVNNKGRVKNLKGRELVKNMANMEEKLKINKNWGYKKLHAIRKVKGNFGDQRSF